MPLPNKGEQGHRFWREAGIGDIKPTSLCEFERTANLISELSTEKVNGERQLVLSDEAITSLHGTLALQELTVKRMQQVCEDPAVILVLRRQQDMLRSRYTQHKVWKQWATLGLRLQEDTDSARRSLYKVTGTKVIRFDKWVDYGIRSQFGNWFSNLNYFFLYEIYAKALGEEKVHVLFFEDLVNQSADFSATLASIFGIDPKVVSEVVSNKRNASSAKFPRKILRSPVKGGLGILNTVRLMLHQVLDKGGINPSISDEILNLVRKEWGEQNRLLQKVLNTDLEKKGYLV